MDLLHVPIDMITRYILVLFFLVKVISQCSIVIKCFIYNIPCIHFPFILTNHRLNMFFKIPLSCSLEKSPFVTQSGRVLPHTKVCPLTFWLFSRAKSIRRLDFEKSYLSISGCILLNFNSFSKVTTLNSLLQLLYILHLP